MPYAVRDVSVVGSNQDNSRYVGQRRKFRFGEMYRHDCCLPRSRSRAGKDILPIDVFVSAKRTPSIVYDHYFRLFVPASKHALVLDASARDTITSIQVQFPCRYAIPTYAHDFLWEKQVAQSVFEFICHLLLHRNTVGLHTGTPRNNACRTMSAVPRPPGNATTRSTSLSSSIFVLRSGPAGLPCVFQSAL